MCTIILIALVGCLLGCRALGHRHAHCGAGENCASNDVAATVQYNEQGDPKSLPVASCPEGYDLHGLECISLVFVEPKLACKHGQTMKNGRCYKVASENAKARCPPGFDQTHGRCVRRTFSEPLKKCPRNMHLSEGECTYLALEPQVAKCPRGMEPTADGNCRSVVEYDALPFCPAGWELKKSPGGAMCVQNKTSEPHFQCRNNDPCRDGLCVALVQDRARFKCSAHGFKLEKDILTNKLLCAAKVALDATVSCPRGSLENGACVEHERTSPKYTCPPDYEHENDVCAKNISEEPFYECPHKFALYQGMCRQEIKHPLNYTCPPGSTFSNRKKLCEFNAAPKEPLLVCPEDYLLSENRCVKTQETSPLYECTEGSELIDGECVKYIKSPDALINNCSTGKRLGGKCVAEDVVEATLSCKNNQELDELDRCLQVFYDEFRYHCKRGELILDKCRIISHKAPAKVCPDGSVHNRGRCTRYIEHPAEPFCPGGAELQHPDICVATKVLDPSY